MIVMIVCSMNTIAFELLPFSKVECGAIAGFVMQVNADLAACGQDHCSSRLYESEPHGVGSTVVSPTMHKLCIQYNTAHDAMPFLLIDESLAPPLRCNSTCMLRHHTTPRLQGEGSLCSH